MSDDAIILLVALLYLLIYVVPMIWVLVSGRSHGGAECDWFLVTFFLMARALCLLGISASRVS